MKSNMLVRFAVLASAVAMVSALCATASQAATWRSNNGVPYSGGGVGGPSTGTGGGLTINSFSFIDSCTGSSGGVVANAPTGSDPWPDAVDTSLTFSGCRIGGVSGMGFRCQLSLDANQYNNGATTTYLGSAGKVTTGLVHVRCTYSLPGGSACATLVGTADGKYQNPSVLTGDLPTPVSTSTDGRYTLVASGQRLTVTVTGPCPVTGGAAVLTAPGGTDYILNLTSGSPQPVIWKE
ncbi:MAG TPA: hypothetical protein VI318_02275 [Baekduia sp.]